MISKPEDAHLVFRVALVPWAPADGVVFQPKGHTKAQLPFCYDADDLYSAAQAQVAFWNRTHFVARYE